MSKTNRGWWKIDINIPVNDYDLEYIASMVRQGYTEGEVVSEEGESDEDGFDSESSFPGLYAVLYSDGSRTQVMSYSDACRVSDLTDGTVVHVSEEASEDDA